MRGYVERKGDRWYAVVYEGLDPVTGRERRRWQPAGTTREAAEKLTARLAADLNGRNDKVRSLSRRSVITSSSWWMRGSWTGNGEAGGCTTRSDRSVSSA